MKRWWNKDIAKLRQVMRSRARLAYRHCEDRTHGAHEQHRQARNTYADAIAKAKKDTWVKFLETLDSNTIWTANKYALGPATDSGSVRIPDLVYKDEHNRNKLAATNEDKAKAFYDTFFTKRIDTETDYNTRQNYPTPKFIFKPITDEQIRRAIKRIAPYKAPGPSGIPNIVLKKCANILVPLLGPIFRATFYLEMYPQAWKESITLVLRKPGKPSYTKPGTYRPIALLDTISKVLSSCVAEDLTKFSEIHNLLPPNHFGCRPGRTTTNVLHYLTSYTKDMWRKNKVVGALFLDIKV